MKDLRDDKATYVIVEDQRPGAPQGCQTLQYVKKSEPHHDHDDPLLGAVLVIVMLVLFIKFGTPPHRSHSRRTRKPLAISG